MSTTCITMQHLIHTGSKVAHVLKRSARKLRLTTLSCPNIRMGAPCAWHSMSKACATPTAPKHTTMCPKIQLTTRPSSPGARHIGSEPGRGVELALSPPQPTKSATVYTQRATRPVPVLSLTKPPAAYVPPARSPLPPTRISTRHIASNFSDELGELIHHDSLLYLSVGLSLLITQRRGRGDLTALHNIHSHPAHHLLHQYRHCGAPIILTMPPWTPSQVHAAATCGPHKSARDHHTFLQSNMAAMVRSGQWIVLPLALLAHLPGLRLSPIGVVPQRNRRP